MAISAPCRQDASLAHTTSGETALAPAEVPNPQSVPAMIRLRSPIAATASQRSSFTPKQGQYLAFIDAYTRVNRRPPDEREMQWHFGVTPPSVHQMILTLERAGLTRGQSRAAPRLSFLSSTYPS